MLPASLKQVEYIETGTSGSYFETGITPSAATVVEFDGNAVSGEACLFGSRASMYASKYMTVFTSGGFYRVDFGGRNAAVSASYVSGVRHLFRQEAYTLYIDGTQVASGSTGDMSGAIPLIALGACRTGTSLDNIGPVRMYSMKIWQDGALVADYIPAKDASDAACIWDDVAQTTRYPTGTGTFVAGPEVQTRTLTGIRVVPPTKTAYIQGESLDLTGMEVYAQYDDGTEEQLSSGYTVSGYSAGTSGTQTITVAYEGFSAAFTVTVTATYTVRFLDWDATVLKTEAVAAGGSATPPSDPAREGYRFTGWNGSYTNVRQDEDVTATYTEIPHYTVTFRDWDGTVLKEQIVEEGSNASPPADPTRVGYRFSGWSGNYINVQKAETVTATYREASKYTVRFLDWDDTLLSEQIVEEGDAALSPLPPQRDGYLFLRWDTSFSNITDDTDTHAVYDPIPYTSAIRIYDEACRLLTSAPQRSNT